jgi:formylglycine-generating enzyme required for sulfatase activity
MKNTLNKIGFTAIIAVISLTALLMTGCPPDDSGGGGGGGGGAGGGTGGGAGGSTPTKTNPTITVWPTAATITYGAALSASALNGGTSAQTGTFAWTEPTTIPTVYNNGYSVTFTPTDTANYNTVTKRVSISVNFVAGTAPEMISITGGTFTMGSPTSELDRYNDETQHSVTLSGFKMSKYQVTQAQYQAVMGSNPSEGSSNPQAGETQGKRPVENVRWYDALVFCNKLSIKEGLTPAYRISESTDPAVWGTVPKVDNATWDAVVIVAGSTGYRLPTEAQWEYACRAGTTTAYNTGTTISDNTGWYSKNSDNKTHEVGKKPANAWGLYDMHGNVSEWCWDWYGDYSSGTQTNPAGAVNGSYRVLRGGNWTNDSWHLRSARRRDYPPCNVYPCFGFRLVRPN